MKRFVLLLSLLGTLLVACAPATTGSSLDEAGEADVLVYASST
jgi:hypothetical protein